MEHHFSAFPSHYPGTDITKDRLLETGHGSASVRVGAHHIANLTYITDACFLVQASVP